MKPKISVIMPVYNAQQFIAQAIKSILAQTFKDFEFIIIEDGSTDKSPKIISQFQHQDSRIRIFFNSKNLGMAKSLNLGIKRAKGKYIARQDADDISHPDRLKRQAKFFKENRNYGLIGTFVKEIDINNNVNKKVFLPTGSTIIQNLSVRRTSFAHGSVMIRKSVLKKTGIYSEKLKSKSGIEDFELWTRIVTVTKTDNLPKFLYRLRKNPKGISTVYRTEQQKLHTDLTKTSVRRFQKLKLPHKPVVSVIITTYNRPNYLESAINSAINQTYKSLEIIIVDDGSKPSAERVVNKFKDPRIAFVRQKNQDVIVARNTGLLRAHGDYIAFLDDDDAWHKDKIKKQLSKFKTSKLKNLGLVYCYHHWINEKGEITGNNKISLKGRLFKDLLYGNKICGSTSSALIKAQTLDHSGKFDQNFSFGEDWQLWLRISANFQIDYVPEYLVSIRKSSKQRGEGRWQIPLYRFKISYTAAKLIAANPHLRTTNIIKEYLLAARFTLISPFDHLLAYLLTIDIPNSWWSRPILTVRKKYINSRYPLVNLPNTTASIQKSPLVSVVIPTFNRAGLLTKSLSSVLKQSYQNLEIIVVDDGSKPSAKTPVEKFKSNRINFIRQKNQGLASARNTGIKNAHGDYIAFLDDDDAWHKDKIKKQLSKFKTSKLKNLGLVYCYHHWINEKGEITGNNMISSRGNLFNKLILGNTVCGSGSAVMIKSEVFKKTGFFNLSFKTSEDWEMWLRISCYYTFDLVAKPLVSIRKTQNRLSQNKWLVTRDRFKLLITATRLTYTIPHHRTKKQLKLLFKAYIYALSQLTITLFNFFLNFLDHHQHYLEPVLNIYHKAKSTSYTIKFCIKYKNKQEYLKNLIKRQLINQKKQF